jgi:hypothetical protein
LLLDRLVRLDSLDRLEQSTLAARQVDFLGSLDSLEQRSLAPIQVYFLGSTDTWSRAVFLPDRLVS